MTDADMAPAGDAAAGDAQDFKLALADKVGRGGGRGGSRRGRGRADRRAAPPSLQRHAYRAHRLDAKDKAKLQAEILDAIFARGEEQGGARASAGAPRPLLLSHPSHHSLTDAAPLYEATCAELGWPVDAAKLAAMRAAHAATLATLDAALAEAEEQEGDAEVRDALVAKANALCDAGDRAGAVAAFAAADAKTAGAGLKLDSALALLRLDMAAGDWRSVREGLAAAVTLAEGGGDWERKNRLRMYQAAHHLATRDLGAAAALLVDGISTFTA
jgi:hypothetical protein